MLRRGEIDALVAAATYKRQDRGPWSAEIRKMLLSVEAWAASHPPVSFERWWLPFEAYACESLLTSLPEGAVLELRYVLPRARRYLRSSLDSVARPCLALQKASMHAAAEALCRLEGRKVHGHYDPLELMRAFPVLARLFAEHIRDWRKNLHRLATRVREDREALQRLLFNGRDLGDLVGLVCDLSDRHGGGQTVALLRFQAGHVIYKPRSGEPECSWFALLDWVNRQGLRPPVKTLRVIRRRGYCWVEYAQSRDCKAGDAQRRFWRRLGSLICISHLLEVVDCHQENVVAAGEHPVLVDAEALLHPRPHTCDAGAEADTLLRTGWLPTGHDRDDLIRGIRCKGRMPEEDESQEIQAGFADCWQLLVNDAGRWSSFMKLKQQLAKHKWRYITRPTSWYAEVCRASIQPQLMTLGSCRRAFVMTCCGLEKVKLAQTESTALLRLEIPRFIRRRDDFARSSYESGAPLHALLNEISCFLSRSAC